MLKNSVLEKGQRLLIIKTVIINLRPLMNAISIK